MTTYFLCACSLFCWTVHDIGCPCIKTSWLIGRLGDDKSGWDVCKDNDISDDCPRAVGSGWVAASNAWVARRAGSDKIAVFVLNWVNVDMTAEKQYLKNKILNYQIKYKQRDRGWLLGCQSKGNDLHPTWCHYIKRSQLSKVNTSPAMCMNMLSVFGQSFNTQKGINRSCRTRILASPT